MTTLQAVQALCQVRLWLQFPDLSPAARRALEVELDRLLGPAMRPLKNRQLDDERIWLLLKNMDDLDELARRELTGE